MVKQGGKVSDARVAKVVDESAGDDLRDSLESLCRSIAGLDDAGLPIPHKSAIAMAKKLRKILDGKSR